MKVCAICGKTEVEAKIPDNEEVVCDHCHGSGSCRCLQCNTAVGLNAAVSVVCSVCHGKGTVPPYRYIGGVRMPVIDKFFPPRYSVTCDVCFLTLCPSCNVFHKMWSYRCLDCSHHLDSCGDAVVHKRVFPGHDVIAVVNSLFDEKWVSEMHITLVGKWEY